jgi:hypothetical protein
MRSVVRPPTTARVVSQVEPDPGRLDAPSRRRTVRVALIATLVGLLAFLIIQGLLAAYNLDVMRDAVDRGWLDVSRSDPFRNLLGSFGYGAVSYLMLALSGSAIAGRGHRVVFALPAAAYVLVTVLVGSHQPEPIGIEWRLECYSACSAQAWFGHPWFGPLIDLGLVLVPGWAVARSVRPRRWPGRTDAATVAAILVAVSGVAIVGWTIAVIDSYIDLRTIVPIGALGLALGVARPWWPWLQVLFATYAAGLIGLILDLLIWPDPNYPLSFALPHALKETWPIAAVGLIASAWQPLAWAIRKLQERPVRLVIAVNVLNLVDAVMTVMAVRSGGAYESNPVVRLVGLPAKVVLVGLLTWLLYRRKPSAMVWPFAALTLVAAYHVAGIIVNGWR